MKMQATQKYPEPKCHPLLQNAHPEALTRLSLTGLTKSGESIDIEYWEIDWNSKNEITDTILVRDSFSTKNVIHVYTKENSYSLFDTIFIRDDSVPNNTITIQYSSLRFEQDYMNQYALIKIHDHFIGHKIIVPDGDHLFRNRDTSTPSLFTEKHGVVTVNSDEAESLNALFDFLKTRWSMRFKRKMPAITYNVTRIFFVAEQKAGTICHNIRVGKTRLVISESGHTELVHPMSLMMFLTDEGMKLSDDEDLHVEMKNSVDVFHFLNYISDYFNVPILTRNNM